MHSNLTEREAQVVWAHLALYTFDAEDQALLDSAKAKLSKSIQTDPHAYYRHLVAQGKSQTEARAHVRHRHGVTL